MSDKYNGWTNYETWRVALEFVDSDYYAENSYDDMNDLASYIEDTVYELLDGECFERNTITARDSLASSLIVQFLQRVNWLEIAELVAEGHNLFTDEECA